MAHIFLSYAREDIETAKRLAAVLRARGWEVWWDTRLKAGEVWDEVIERALEGACCVLVLWSGISINKRWVRAEASSGLERGILVPALIEGVRPPLIFRSVQHEDLTGWAGDDDHLSLLRLLDAVSGFVVPGPPPVVPAPPPFAHASGKDGFGRWIDVAVPSGEFSGLVVQRFRWIEPGTFLMGSPDDEAEREDWEGPRHRVTLTRGLWLADTACTQALWRAVMGETPSRFKGDTLPVETVSWNDALTFLSRLKDKVSGLDPRLPTEAQWEYACRAGTGTPFSFGAQITPDQVNYDGNYPYAGGNRGVRRGMTVPVKSLPPNAWGLYEMHGNVWEWCADGLRRYTAEPQVDPVGELGGGDAALRAVRGGSWYGHAWWVRSAYRLAALPGLADFSLGFRLSLSVCPRRC